MKSWQSLQLLNRQLSTLTSSVLIKEKELKEKYKSSLEKYHKNKNSLLFYRENNRRYLGFDGRNTPKPHKKVKVALGELIIGYHRLKNYLFEIRNSLSLQLTLIKTLSKDEEGVVAKFFVNSFFDSARQSLIELIEKLIEEEARRSPSPFVSEFIHPDSFIGKLIEELIRTSEISEYASFAFKEIVNSLDTLKLAKVKMSFEEETKKKKKDVADSGDFEILDKKELESDYMKTSAIHSNHLSKKPLCMTTISQVINHSHSHSQKSSRAQSVTDECHIDHNKGKEVFHNTPNSHSQAIHDYYNTIKANSITERRIRLKALKESNETLRDFYIDTLQVMTSHPEIYSTDSLSDLFTKASEPSIENFMQTSQITIDIVSQIIAKLLNTNCIPEILRKISKIIASVLKQRNPCISHYVLLSYVGKFFYEKCLSSLLYFPEIYGIEMENKILEVKSRAILVIANQVLSHLFSFKLFQSPISPLYTPLNHHIIQWLSSVISIVESLIEDSAEDIVDHGIHQSHLQSFGISMPELYLLIDKSPSLLERLGKKEKDYLDLFETKKLLINQSVESYFIFCADELNPQILAQCSAQKKKAKLLEYADDHNYIEEISYAIFRLLHSLPFLLTSKSIDVVALFKGINQKLQFSTDQNTIEAQNTMPLAWYSNYIVSHLPHVPIEYSTDNYQGLYDRLYAETSSIYEKLIERDSVLTYDLAYELNALSERIQQVTSSKQKMKTLLIDIFRLNFIEITPVKICFMSGIDLIKLENKCNFTFPPFDPNSLTLFPQRSCIHMKIKTELRMSSQEDEAFLKNECHFNYIHDFIAKVRQYSLFCEDYQPNSETPQDLSDISKNKKTNDILFYYIDLIKAALSSSHLLPFYDLLHQEAVLNDLKEEIQDYILYKIWDPDNVPLYLEEYNRQFYSTCLKLSWIDPDKHLKIRKECISSHHMKTAVDFLKRIDQARTPGAIITWFNKATDIILKTFQFSSSKGDVGADDINPIYLYLLILIQPRRIISQFAFCKLFLSQKNALGKNGYILTTLEWALGCIREINHETLNIDKEAFDKQCNASKMQFISENLKNL